MRVKLYYGFLVLLIGSLYLTACDNSTGTEFEESFELYTGLEAIEGAENSTFVIKQGRDLKNDGYFQVNISDIQENGFIKTGLYNAWCIEWKKPLRSSNDEHKGVKLYSTNGNEKWKPLTYFFSIKTELLKEDPSLTYREIQAVIWSLAGYIGVAPEFDLDKLSINEVPSRLRENGELVVDRNKVRSILNRVKTEYTKAKFKLADGGEDLNIAETEGDQQDVVLDPVARIELTPSPLSLAVDEQRTMTARAFDADGNELTDAEFTWSIDDASIATVDQNGVVTGVTVGQTIVRVVSNGVEATATVNVTAIVDNLGNEFIIGILPNFDASNTIEVHLTSDVSADVTIEYPINSPTFTTTVTLVPGDITIVEIPNSSSQGWSAGSVDNNAIRAASNQDFVMYATNIRPFSSDAALGLPVSVLGNDYLINTYFSNIVSSDRGLFSVIATEDNTQVEIVPTKALAGGFSANTSFTITLNRGEGFLGQSTTFGAEGDLTGTTVSSSAPVAVTNGNQCTNVPPENTACDHIFEIAHPLSSWTTETLAPPLPNRPLGSVYRVLASQDNTTIERNGVAETTLNAGEFYETDVVTGAQLFTANNPIFATQYMTGQGQSGTSTGDPAMGNLIPTEQFLSNYTFSTVGGGQFAEHFLNLVAHNDDISSGTILFDGTAVPAADFTAITGTNFSYAQIPLTEGTHSTSSSSQPHGIYVIGFNSFDSYIYPGGAGISEF